MTNHVRGHSALGLGLGDPLAREEAGPQALGASAVAFRHLDAHGAIVAVVDSVRDMQMGLVGNRIFVYGSEIESQSLVTTIRLTI